jgi:hypothetical protein
MSIENIEKLDLAERIQAYKAALWIAYTAETEEQSEKALDIAVETGFELEQEEKAKIMTMIENQLEDSDEH